MQAPFVIDTNIVSELTRPQPQPSVIAFLGTETDLYLSVIVFHELGYGIECTRDADRRVKLQTFAAMLRAKFAGRIIDVDIAVSEAAGRLRGLEKARGRVLAELDALIAATALIKGATLVTRNVKDFAGLEIPLFNPWDGISR